MPRQPNIIRHPDDLNGLSTMPGVRIPGSGRIRIQADEGLDPERREKFEQRLNRLYFACGCDRAALGLVLGLAGLAVWLSTRRGGLEALGWSDLWVGLAVVLAATYVGKLTGLSRANRELKEAAAELKREWKAPPRPTGEISGCG